MEELISIFQGILMFFEKHAVQIFPAIFAVFIVVLFVVLLSHRILKRKKAFVLESSAYYHKVESLNDRYSFQEDIFDDGCFDYTYVFDTKQKYDHYSVNEVMNALLQEKLQVFEQAIKDVDKNKDEYRKYCAEFENLHSEITVEECKAYKVRYDWYLKTEQALVEEITKKPILEIEVYCWKEYTSPAGRNHYECGKTYHDSEIREMLKNTREYEAYRASEECRRKLERSRITAKIRYQVMRRDQFRCQLCGARAEDGARLHIDHINPVSKGGTSDMGNLRTLCDRCNLGKGDSVEDINPCT